MFVRLNRTKFSNLFCSRQRHLSLKRSVTGKHVEIEYKIPVKKIRNFALLLTAGFVLSGSIVLTADEGLRRTFYFWSNSLVPLIHYRLVQFKTSHLTAEEKAKHFAPLHLKYKDEPLRVILYLKGFYVKIGQVISSLGADEIPEVYINSLKCLQDQVPPRSFNDIKIIIEKELGCKMEEVFLSFNEKAMGAASIGQVHKATLKNGTDVVVKVQYPEVEQYFNLDIQTLKMFCKLAQPEQLPMFDEIEKQFMTEFDYRSEANHLKQSHSNMSEIDEIVIPLPIDNLCTKRVLVMELLKGKALQRKIDEQISVMAKKEGLTIDELKKKFKDKMKEGSLNKQQPINPLLIKAYIAFIQARDYIRNGYALGYNITFGLLGAPIEYVWTDLPIDAEKINKTLFHAHGIQLFKYGEFNGDPHPGNIMLLDDGKIGLIDYGQVKILGVNERINIAKLIIALHENNNEKIVKIWTECGFKSKNMNPKMIEKHARFHFDSFGPEVVDELGGLALFMENLQRIDPVLVMPNEYIMAFRLNVLLRAGAMGMGLTIKTSEMWVDQAKSFLPEAKIKRHFSVIGGTMGTGSSKKAPAPKRVKDPNSKPNFGKDPKLNKEDYIIKKQTNQVIYKLPGSINGQSFNIADCNDCSIYIYDYSATIYVDACKGCKIYIGPCESSVFLRECSDCSFIIACRQLRTRDCSNVKCSLFCCTEPVIESSNNLQFNCYNIQAGPCSYFELASQFKSAKLSIWNNRWSEVHNFTEDKGGWKLLPYEEELFQLAPILDSSVPLTSILTTPTVPITIGLKHKKVDSKTILIAFLGINNNDLAMKFVENIIPKNKDVSLIRIRDFTLQKDWAASLLPKGQVKEGLSNNIIIMELSTDTKDEKDFFTIINQIVNNAEIFPSKDVIYIAENCDKSKKQASDVWDSWKDII